jgi:hypothetical protein
MSFTRRGLVALANKRPPPSKILPGCCLQMPTTALAFLRGQSTFGRVSQS